MFLGSSGVGLINSSDNVVGRIGEGNVIAFSRHWELGGTIYGGTGIEVEGASVGNSIRGNSITDNTRLGIDLDTTSGGANDGVTPNDTVDADTGPNNLQNYPVPQASLQQGAGVTIGGSLHSTPNKPFAIDLYGVTSCDASGYGEGAVYLGTVTLTTDGAGNGSFDTTVPTGGGAYTTATATDASGNTSEFSLCWWNGPPNGCTNDIDCDLILDPVDVCPDLNDPDQLNSSANFVDNSPPYVPAVDDKTWIISSPHGDVCNLDNDSDGILDGNEFDGCENFGIMDPLLPDTDGDRFVDGAECVLGTDPTDFNDRPSAAYCASHLGVALSTDTDGDKVRDYVEFCNYGSNRNSIDTDGDAALDGGKDGCEVASLNGDRIVSSIDQGMLAQGISGSAGYTTNVDINKDGVLSSIDQGIMASFIVPSGQCP